MSLLKSKSAKMSDAGDTSPDLGVAYSTRRQAVRKKLATGGAVDRAEDKATYGDRPDKGYGAIIFKADGGEVEADEHASIAAAIMARRERDKMMAEGGEVDLDENAMEEPSAFDEMNDEALLKENYDEDIHSASQPMDSNEHGDDIDSDDEDRVSAIRRKMRAKSALK